jgi:alkanesulfonate monooxygenase SsuD/methylene tetrahydromethanopterin reductase-like flavin-dependent oxidoreductase (luciferase family)
MATVPTRNPLVLAYQWASLDLLAEGRTIFDACMGDDQDVALMRAEYANMGIDPKDRVALMEENIRIIMRLWTEDQVDYDGHFHQYTAASVSPKPARRPPMWITATPKTEKPHLVERSLRRVVELSDGWMTTAKSPVWYGELWGSLRALGHEMGRPFEEKPRAHYYAINIAANRQAAFEESKKWMDQYYHRDNSPEYVSGSTALGSPEECAQDIMSYVDQGATDVLLRFHSYDPARQFRRFLDEVLPFFD